MNPMSIANLCRAIKIESANKKFLEKTANCFFLPVHYLFGNKIRTYELINSKVQHASLEFVHSDYLKTTLAIIALVPGVILGVVASLFAYLTDRKNILERNANVQNYIENPFYIDELDKGSQLMPFDEVEQEIENIRKKNRCI